MNDTLGLALPICALSLVCVGLLAVIAVIAVRFLGFVVPGWLSHYTDILGGKAERTSILPPDTTRRQRANFSSQAAVDLDFDAAVARHQANKNRPRPTGAPPKPAISAGPAGDAQTPSLRRRRRRPEQDYDDDEVFGGLLDVDGDGSPEL
jgi:hypothetical protein